MKKVLAILLLWCFTAQLSAKAAIITYYCVNKQYIASNLCENKSKPQLECNGQCHLAKQLKKEDQSEGQNTANLKNMAEATVFFQQLTDPIKLHSFSYTLRTVYTFSVNVHGTNAVFHPPCVH